MLGAYLPIILLLVIAVCFGLGSLVFGNQSGNQIPTAFTDLGGNLTIDPLLCTDGLHPGPNSPCMPEHNPNGGGCGVIGALGGGCGR